MNVLCSIHCLLHIFVGRGKYVGTSWTAIGETAVTVMPLGPGHAQQRKGGKPSILYQLFACLADPGRKEVSRVLTRRRANRGQPQPRLELVVSALASDGPLEERPCTRHSITEELRQSI